MVLDPIPQSLPVHFFGSRPQPSTSRCMVHMCVHVCVHVNTPQDEKRGCHFLRDVYIYVLANMYLHQIQYGLATCNRLLKIIRLFCKRALWKRRYSAKETCNFKQPTNRSHPISEERIWGFAYTCVRAHTHTHVYTHTNMCVYTERSMSTCAQFHGHKYMNICIHTYI